MATATNTDLAAFYDFIKKKVQGGADLSPEASVEAFRAYQRDLERLRKEIEPAIERYHRGEGIEIDFDQLEREVIQELAKKGIVE